MSYFFHFHLCGITYDILFVMRNILFYDSEVLVNYTKFIHTQIRLFYSTRLKVWSELSMLLLWRKAYSDSSSLKENPLIHKWYIWTF
jgi:hypothetical protein